MKKVVYPGVKFGKLTVIQKTGKRVLGNTVWACECECGNVVYRLNKNISASIRAGSNSTCGCCSLIGLRFGAFTVTKLADERAKSGAIKWKCVCDCGGVSYKTSDTIRQAVRSGRRSSCWDCKPNRPTIGTRFGHLTVGPVVPDRSRGHRVHECVCDCGGVSYRTGAAIAVAIAKGHNSRCKKCRAKTARENSNGYVRLKLPDHPNSMSDGWVMEHIYIMSKELGRPIDTHGKHGSREVVHHKNGIRNDNRPKNLELRTVNDHPPGQSVSDMITNSVDYLRRYGRLHPEKVVAFIEDWEHGCENRSPDRR